MGEEAPEISGAFLLTQTSAPADSRPHAAGTAVDGLTEKRSMHMDLLEREVIAPDTYRVTIAANEKVRQPPELDFAGISTENYFKNPVVMWAHDVVGRSPSGGLPIGRTLALDWKPGRGLVADFEFLSDDPFAHRVRNAWDKGFLRAASISWAPLESGPSKDGGRRDTKADLLEWSIVSVPADPEALRNSHRLMLDAFLSEDEQTDAVQDRDELTEALLLLAAFAGRMKPTARSRADPTPGLEDSIWA
ncbi:MAG: HK97 family phage prohead protease [Chloroflexi bacterium]|nr:HK97 family phage prohead protease [Chloroflexota bacterium]